MESSHPPTGPCVLTTRVYLSMIWKPSVSMYLPLDLAYRESFDAARFSEKTTSSAVSSSPLWNLTPFFRKNLYVWGSRISQRSARTGTSCFVLPSTVTSGSLICFVMMNDSVSTAWCGSSVFASPGRPSVKVSIFLANPVAATKSNIVATNSRTNNFPFIIHHSLE